MALREIAAGNITEEVLDLVDNPPIEDLFIADEESTDGAATDD